jgi:hypothetical protein
MTQPIDSKDTTAGGETDPQSATFGAFDRRSSASIEQRRIEQLEPAAAHRAPPDPKDLVPIAAMWVLTVLLAVVVIVAFDILLSIWPPEAPAGVAQVPAANPPVPILWGVISVTLTANARLMFIAILMGIIGAMVHAMTSFADFVGNKRLVKSWLPWYFLRPLIGGGLALFFYVTFRAGLLTTATDSNVNPFGIAALGGLAGMFSKQATDKLNEVFSTMFKTSSNSGDNNRSGKLSADSSSRPASAASSDQTAKGAAATTADPSLRSG